MAKKKIDFTTARPTTLKREREQAARRDKFVHGDKLVRLTVDIDPDLRHRFKMRCLQNHRTMIGVIREFIRRYADDE